VADEDREEGISFSEFIYSLGRSAAFAFGDIADPDGGEPGQANLLIAAQMIDVISMLQEKTQGNLSAEEAKFIDDLLYDLRMRFVQAQQQGGGRIIVP
jgi:uncharacterized protein DUF1844